MNKINFMNMLRESLSEYGVKDAREILLDFEQHFEDGAAAGLTEEQVSEKLGDPIEIAKQYISENEEAFADTPKQPEETPGTTGFDSNSYTQAPPPVQPAYQQQAFKPDAGKIIGIICVDLFVFSWTIPVLFALVIALYSVTVSIGASGITITIAGLLINVVDTSSWLFTSFSPISTTLFGVVLMASCPLLVVACVSSTKGCIDIVKHIVNWHSRAIVGRNICTFKNKEAA